MRDLCDSNDSFGYTTSYHQSEGKKDLLLRNNSTTRQDHFIRGQRELRKVISLYTIDSKQNISPKKSTPSWMTGREVPIIIVSSDDTPLQHVRMIRKHRSMPQLVRNLATSSRGSMINNEERMKIKDSISNIPEHLQHDQSSAFNADNKSESIEKIQDDYDLTESNLLEPNYTEDIDDENQLELVVAHKKKITPSYAISRSAKPRIVFMDRLNKWKEQSKSTPDTSSDQENDSIETEILSSNESEKEIMLKSKSIDLPFLRSITEDTSDENYKRSRPSSFGSDLKQKDWTSSDHWKRLSTRKKIEIPQTSFGGDSQDSRVEILMTPEPCDSTLYDKENSSFPKRFSDDPSRFSTLSNVLSLKQSPSKGKFEEKKTKKPPKKQKPSIEILPIETSEKEQFDPSFDAWKRSPLTPKSSQFFTEVNPDNNLKDALAAWEVLQKGYKPENTIDPSTRRRSMTEGNIGIKQHLPKFENIHFAEKRSHDDIVHLDKSLGLDFNSFDNEQQQHKQSSMSKSKKWFINRVRNKEIHKNTSQVNETLVPEHTAEILPSSWVRQSLMDYDTNDNNDVIQAPIQFKQNPSRSFTQQAKNAYFQFQKKEEQKRKKELENLGMLIAWGQISLDEKYDRESIFEENRQTRDLSGLFGQSNQKSIKKFGKSIRRTASDQNTLHQRFLTDDEQQNRLKFSNKTADARAKATFQSQYTVPSEISSINPPKTQSGPPPLPEKASVRKFKKDIQTSYFPPVKNDILPSSHSGISHPINSLVNESLSDTPRSIASMSPDQKTIVPELDAFLIELDQNFHRKNPARNIHIPPSLNCQAVNGTSSKEQASSKSNRRNSLSNMFKWKSIKISDQQNLQFNQMNESTIPISQRHFNSSLRPHQRSKPNLIQLFARHKGESAT